MVGSVSLRVLWGQQPRGILERFLDAGAEELVIWIAVLAILGAMAFYVVGRVRSKAVQQEPRSSELISKFRELHSRGGLSDAEFRTIKTALAEELQEELKDKEETG